MYVVISKHTNADYDIFILFAAVIYLFSIFTNMYTMFSFENNIIMVFSVSEKALYNMLL